MEETVQMKAIVLLWQWWNERNGMREGERMRSVDDLALVIQNAAEQVY